MQNTALMSFDNNSQKWIATFGGKVLISSPNKNYIVSKINNNLCNRAKSMGVNFVREIGQPEKTNQIDTSNKFSINERFDFLADFVKMVVDRDATSLIVTGEGGLGKTFTVNKTLHVSGLISSDEAGIGFSTETALSESQSRKLYTVVRGYSTAKGLYRTLFENRNRIIVFDDCDTVLRDQVALNLLKGALDSYDKRIISWNSESMFQSEDELPRSFEFEGGVIFISNMNIFKIDQAVRSRTICVDVSMTQSQKIERMSAIIKTDEFLPEYEQSVKQQALSFLSSMKNDIKELNLRTLISVTRIANRGGNWKRKAEYLITAF